MSAGSRLSRPRWLAARLWAALTVMGLAGALASRAVACPVCETETGRQIRQGIFDAAFLPNLFYTAIPFLVLGMTVKVLPTLMRRRSSPR